jgi:hypothetical protein
VYDTGANTVGRGGAVVLLSDIRRDDEKAVKADTECQEWDEDVESL